MTALTTPPRSWSKLFTQNAQEFGPTPLTLLSGQIPQGLRGTLYRNGPGTIQRGGQRVGHWFDGDGAILAVHFREDGAKALYRYVKTPSYLAETQADRYLWANYSMTDPQG
ncbi:MAG: carotenoid oxygenase family protein, partial [Microcystaceae cyanobacterium]